MWRDKVKSLLVGQQRVSARHPGQRLIPTWEQPGSQF